MSAPPIVARRRRELQQPEDNTAYLLGQAAARLAEEIVAGVVAADHPIRPAHSAVFVHMEVDGGIRLTKLAARAGMTPQAMGELVDDLVGLGHVERVPDPNDRRAKLIVLTDQGREAVQAAFDTIAEIEQRLEAVLGRASLVKLRATLRRLIADA